MIAIAAVAEAKASASSAPASVKARDVRCAASRSSERDRPTKNARSGGLACNCGARDEPVVGAAEGPGRISLGKGSTAIRFSPELEFVTQCNDGTLSPLRGTV